MRWLKFSLEVALYPEIHIAKLMLFDSSSHLFRPEVCNALLCFTFRPLIISLYFCRQGYIRVVSGRKLSKGFRYLAEGDKTKHPLGLSCFPKSQTVFRKGDVVRKPMRVPPNSDMSWESQFAITLTTNAPEDGREKFEKHFRRRPEQRWKHHKRD